MQRKGGIGELGGILSAGIIMLIVLPFLGGIGIQLLEGANTAAVTVNATTQAAAFEYKGITGINQMGNWFSITGTTLAAVFILGVIGLLMHFGGGGMMSS